jgi:hypothetical protein
MTADFEASSGLIERSYSAKRLPLCLCVCASLVPKLYLGTHLSQKLCFYPIAIRRIEAVVLSPTATREQTNNASVPPRQRDRASLDCYAGTRAFGA